MWQDLKYLEAEPVIHTSLRISLRAHETKKANKLNLTKEQARQRLRNSSIKADAGLPPLTQVRGFRTSTIQASKTQNEYGVIGFVSG